MIDSRDARLRDWALGPTAVLEDASRAAGPVVDTGTLSFVIPVRNDAARLQRCLASIHHSLQDVRAEIVVADNGSTDQSAEVAREAGAVVLSLPGLSVGEIRNLAAAHASGDLLAFVDADHELASGWVPATLGVMQDHAIAAAGDYCHAPADGSWVQQMYDKLRARTPGFSPVDWLGSGNLVVRRDAFEAVGGFDTRLETCEDVDLCQRLIARGGRIMAVSAMVNVHHGDPGTLRALFRGELWRGRDNLKVSLRAPLTWRSLPGLAIPVLTLLALVVTLAGAVMPWARVPVVIGGLLGLVALAVPRAIVLMARTPVRDRGVTHALRALVFSTVYNLARALALVSRAGHGTRRAR